MRRRVEAWVEAQICGAGCGAIRRAGTGGAGGLGTLEARNEARFEAWVEARFEARVEALDEARLEMEAWQARVVAQFELGWRRGLRHWLSAIWSTGGGAG